MHRTWGSTLLLASMLLTSCVPGSPADDGASDAAPCTEILEVHDARQAELRTTAGGGVEGRDALAAVVELIESRPDCFRESDIAWAAGARELLPVSAAEAAAIEAAEARCPADALAYEAVSGSDVVSSTPEHALTAATELTLPRGTPERVEEGDGWVAFDLHDGDVLTGRAFVHPTEDGWFVRRVIACRGGDDLVEDVTDDGVVDQDEDPQP